jgi:transcriptional regulator with XRE-family HTH domain
MERSDPKTTRRVLARNVRRLRSERGLSQEALAEEVGLRQAQISEIESGANNITIDNLHRLAVALGVRPFELIDERTGKS